MAEPKELPPKNFDNRTPGCPECRSERVWRDGYRYLNNGVKVQRWLCRLCGFRFSESISKPNVKLNVACELSELLQSSPNLAEAPMRDGNFTPKKTLNNLPLPLTEDSAMHNATNLGKNLNTFCSKISNAEHCAGEEPAKSSAQAVKGLEEKAYAESQATGATVSLSGIPPQDLGRILEYAWHLKKEGFSEATIESRVRILKRLVKLGARLDEPESLKDVIARQSWSNGRKELAVEACTSFLKFLGKAWSPPRYKREETLPWIPTEKEIDQLIAGVSKRYAAFLQLIKETGMRAREAFNLKWDQVDLETSTVRVTPEKGSNPRIYKISSKLTLMLLSLPREGNRVFGNCDYRDFSNNLRRQRNRIAEKLKNLRIKRITPLSIRHWKGTWEYHRTKDILHVMKILGHKNIKNTLVYVQIEQAIFKGEKEYVCKVVRTINEAKELIESGFEYVCEIDGVKLFRKPK